MSKPQKAIEQQVFHQGVYMNATEWVAASPPKSVKLNPPVYQDVQGADKWLKQIPESETKELSSWERYVQAHRQQQMQNGRGSL